MLSSPLRYPGGKAKLYPFFAELINKNDLFGTEYCEPYAGGAGLALKLLSYGFVDKIALNDIDVSIFSFWKSAIENNDKFCALVEKTPVTVKEWHNQKAIWTAGDRNNPLALGFSAYFLNRTNRSGIIEGAGPIGGYEQKGKWKIDVRLIKDKQVENLRTLAQYANQIKVHNLDALEFLRRTISKKNTFTYLDPPYYVKGSKLYKNFYTDKDHRQIAAELKKKRNAKWVVSYDDVSQIRQAYASFEPITYSLNYSAGAKGLGSEVIYLSDSLEAPDIEGFLLAA